METALCLPLLLLIIFNAINFGYFLLVAVNVAAAPRSGVEYSILGSVTPATLQLPVASPPTTNTTISYLAYQDMTGALYHPANADVQVCTDTLGFNNFGASNQTAQCVTCSNGTSACGSAGTGDPAPASDPESPSFVLHRVDVTYQFNPLIPGTPFGLTLLPSDICSSSFGPGGGGGPQLRLPPIGVWTLLPLEIWAFVLVMLTAWRLRAGRRRRPMLVLAFALCLVLLWASCGGGGCGGGGGTITCTFHRQLSMRAMD